MISNVDSVQAKTRGRPKEKVYLLANKGKSSQAEAYKTWEIKC